MPLDYRRGNKSFFYILGVTIISVALIILNVLLGMKIPFSVQFLIAYVGALLVFVIWHSVLTKGWKRSIVMFLLSFIVAFTAEALGVNFGLIFGRYFYTGVLGYQLFGVPFLAALAWEPIVYAAFLISDILAPTFVDSSHPLVKKLPAYIWLAIISALATTAWDMMIDPIAVSNNWWVWIGGGSYMPYVANGVPIQNFIGWLSVSFTINLLYRLISSKDVKPQKSSFLALYGPVTLYTSLFLTAAGVSITILKRPEVALIGLLAMGPFIAISLTNINLVKQGLSTFFGTGWLEVEGHTEPVKTGTHSL